VALGTPQGVENGGEFFREREQAAVRGRLLIAQSIDKRSGRQASGGDAFGDPGLVDFSEEVADLVPACSLAGLAGFADQHHEKVETMAGSIDHAVGCGTNGIAERGQQLEEDGGGMGFAVWGQAAYGQPRDAVECGIAEDWIRGRTGRRRCGRRRGVCRCVCGSSRSCLPVSSAIRRCMSGKVVTDGRPISSKGLDFMICLLARFRIGIESHWSVGVVVEGGTTQT
jgi:hypothetical protein